MYRIGVERSTMVDGIAPRYIFGVSPACELCPDWVCGLIAYIYGL